MSSERIYRKNTCIVEGNIIDTFVTTNLLANWDWIDANRLGPGTNTTALLIVPQVLGLTDVPKQLFVKMLDRASENGDMLDRDSDGSPNVYEVHNDTNPYVADFENAPKITVAPDSGYEAFTNALWTSTPYSIIQIAGEMYFNESIDLPDWPIMITGPTNGYAVIHSSADIGVFMVNRQQTDHTLIRNVYLTMDKQSSFQAGFWIGGNLPWEGRAAGASFENVRLRMYNPGTWYYGWHMYGITDTPVVINNCTISAAGATDVLPVYVYGDSQVVVTNGLDLINMPGSPTPGYTYAGYALNGLYDSGRDSDEDGVNDYDEIYAYGTDIYLKDSDGDRITDGEEVSHGANPTNQNVYCFSLSVTVDNNFSRAGSLKLAFYEPETNSRISDVAEIEQQHMVVEFHYVTTESRLPELRAWSASDEVFVSVPFSVRTHNNNVTISTAQLRQLYDADNDDMPDVWEVAHGLSPQDAHDAMGDLDGDGLINLHEWWASCDPLVPDGSNTVLSVLSRSIDSRLSEDPSGKVEVYDNYYSSDMSANTNCWAFGIDFSCASPYNSAEWNCRAGTAITDQHIVLANHYHYTARTRVEFIDSDGSIIERTVIDGARVADTDIYICLLDSPLPETVHPAALLPPNYADYIGNGKGLPVLVFDQDEHAIVAELESISSHQRPLSDLRQSYFEVNISGDSGDPVFLVHNDTVILLYTLYTAYFGPFLTDYADKIQNVMDQLSERNNQSLKQLNFFDFSQYDGH